MGAVARRIDRTIGALTHRVAVVTDRKGKRTGDAGLRESRRRRSLCSIRHLGCFLDLNDSGVAARACRRTHIILARLRSLGWPPSRALQGVCGSHGFPLRRQIPSRRTDCGYTKKEQGGWLHRRFRVLISKVVPERKHTSAACSWRGHILLHYIRSRDVTSGSHCGILSLDKRHPRAKKRAPKRIIVTVFRISSRR